MHVYTNEYKDPLATHVYTNEYKEPLAIYKEPLISYTCMYIQMNTKIH
jgi:hypothetical protein